MIGGTIIGPGIFGVLKGCRNHTGVTWEPVLFSNYQAELTSVLADIILPPDDKPGARELDVPQFIDRYVNEVYTKNEQDSFLEGLDSFNISVRESYDRDFVNLDPEERHKFVADKNEESLSSENRSSEHSFFLNFKELTLMGYFNTEVGATEVLQYQMNFEVYIGCAPLEEVGGKNWAT